MGIQREGSGVRILRIDPPDARVRIPGSKSLTNRHLLCAALADGVSELAGASASEDSERMREALASLGIRVEPLADDRLRVHGCRGMIPQSDVLLDAGDAGTAMRFLTALCCLGHGRYAVDGSPRMRERPIGDLVEGLSSLGAAIGYGGRAGFPPLNIAAHGLPGGEVVFHEPPSSQFLSAILMVAPYAARDVFIDVQGPLPSRPYVDMTIASMRRLGVEVLEQDERFIVAASQRYAGGRIEIEPDASGATYFWAAAAVTGGRVEVLGLNRSSAQGDVQFAHVLERMGCRVEFGDRSIAVSGPPRGELRGLDVDLNRMPDTVQTLAVVALFARGRTTIRNVANLRIKETDRLAALRTELSRLGASVELLEDGLAIEPPHEVQGAAIETYSDHRMAMSIAVAGLAADGVLIRDAGCVSKSFPDFFERLGEL